MKIEKIKKNILLSKELEIPAIVVPTKNETFVIYITKNNELFISDDIKYFTAIKERNNKLDYNIKDVIGFDFLSKITQYKLNESNIFSITTENKNTYRILLDTISIIK